MRNLTSCTCPSRTRTSMAPSPSTRARTSVRISRSAIAGLALGAERRRGRVEGSIQAHDVLVGHAVGGHPGAERRRVGLFHRAEAAVAAAVVAGAQRSTAGVG